jgi:hypothetical protein
MDLGGVIRDVQAAPDEVQQAPVGSRTASLRYSLFDLVDSPFASRMLLLYFRVRLQFSIQQQCSVTAPVPKLLIAVRS